MISKLIDTAITWALYWGVWLLAVLVFHKTIGISGTIRFIISISVGFAAAYVTKPIMEKLVKYQILLVICAVWALNIYLMAHS